MVTAPGFVSEARGGQRFMERSTRALSLQKPQGETSINLHVGENRRARDGGQLAC